nr:sigma-70 family RNA polymerase sigma factor [uncultured Acetatifactor sp.]
MAYTDQEIQELIKQDKNKGAAALLETYTGLLWSVCARRLQNPEDIRECVNDAFSEFCLHADRYDEAKSSLRNYLCMIADRKALNRYRDNCRRERAESAASGEQAWKEDGQEAFRAPGGAGDGEYTREELEAAIDKLDPMDSQIIRMKYYQGLSYQEIAEKLALNYETVKKRGQRSLKKLWKILVIGLIILLLAACAVIVSRYFQFAEGVGFSWSEENPIYRMTEVSDPCWADGFTFSVDNVAYRDGRMYFSIDCKTDKEPENEEERTRQNTVYQTYAISLEVKDLAMGSGGSKQDFDNVQLIKTWQPEEELPESFTIEIELAAVERYSDDTFTYSTWEGEEEVMHTKPLNLQGPNPKFTVTLSRVSVQEDISAIGAFHPFGDTGFVVCPGIRNEEETRFSLYLLNEGLDAGKYGLSPYLVDRGDTKMVTLTGADGTVWEANWTDCGFWGLDEVVLTFPPLEPGEYTMTIPYLRMESSQISGGAYIALPKEEGETVACDETLLFPDGSGYHLTGVHMEYYETGDEIVYEDGEDWVVNYALEPTFVYELMLEPISAGNLLFQDSDIDSRYFYGNPPREEAGASFELDQETWLGLYRDGNWIEGGSAHMGGAGVFLNLQQPEGAEGAPDWVELRLKDPWYNYDQNFQVKVIIE